MSDNFGQADKELKKKIRNLLEQYQVSVSNVFRCTLESIFFTFSNDYSESVGHYVLAHNSFTSDFNQSEQCLPEGVKFFYREPNWCWAVVQQLPQVRTVKVQQNDALKTYQLAFPYCVFILYLAHEDDGWHFCDLQMGYSNRNITKISDVLYAPNVPNCNNFLICLGHNEIKKGEINEVIREAIGLFWQSHFNLQEWTRNFVLYRDCAQKLFGSLEIWQQNTLKNPFFPLEYQWESESRGKDLLSFFSSAAASCSNQKHTVMPVFCPGSTASTIAARLINEAVKKIQKKFNGLDVQQQDEDFIEGLTNIFLERIKSSTK